MIRVLLLFDDFFFLLSSFPSLFTKRLFPCVYSSGMDTLMAEEDMDMDMAVTMTTMTMVWCSRTYCSFLLHFFFCHEDLRFFLLSS